MTIRKRPSYHYKPRSRTQKNPLVTLLQWLVLLGAIALLYLGGRWIVGKVRTWMSPVSSIGLVVRTLSGPVSFQISGQDTWTPLYTDQTLYEGDTLRTKPSSTVGLYLTNSPTSTLALGPDSELTLTQYEENSRERVLLESTLQRGTLFLNVDSSYLSTHPDSHASIAVAQSTVTSSGGKIELTHPDGTEPPHIYVVEGSATVDIPYTVEDKERIITVPLGVGQALTLTPSTAEDAANGTTVVTRIPEEYFTSSWYLDQLETWDSAAATAAREAQKQLLPVATTDPSLTPSQTIPEPDTPDGTEAATTLDPPVFLYPQPGEAVEAQPEHLVILKGEAPPNTAQIVVNDYTLQLYKPGDPTWSYFAKGEYNTLHQGDNTYTAYAIARDGSRSPVASLTFQYLGDPSPAPAAAPVTEQTSAAAPTTEDTETTESTPEQPSSEATPSPDTAEEAALLPPPVVTYPAASPFQTAASKVTIRGTVESEVSAVMVNDYKLKQYTPGSGTWQYLANADMGNMQKGPNSYTITAVWPTGGQSSSTVEITYSPLENIPGL